MSLRRVLLGLRNHTHDHNLSKNLSYRNCYFSSASATTTSLWYPIGKDPSSLPLALTQKLPQNPVQYLIDERPISLRYRVDSMLELGQLDKAAEISRLVVLEKYRNCPDTIFICNDIIRDMSDAKRYDEAIALFHYFFNESNLVPNIVSFNLIIKVHCYENRIDEALELYRHVRSLKIDDEYTYRFLIKGLVDSERLYEAVGMIKAVAMFDSLVYSYLIRSFLDQGNHHKADRLFDNFIRKEPKIYPCEKESSVDEGYDDELYMGFLTDEEDDGESDTEVPKTDEEYDEPDTAYDETAMLDATLVDYWFRQGNEEKAMGIYKFNLRMRAGKGIQAKTSNTLLRVLLEHGKKSEAWELFNRIFKLKFDSPGRFLGVKRFDSETINIMVNECFELDMVMKAMDTFRKGECFSRCYKNIIEKLCERGMMSEAEGLFEKMLSDEDLVLSYEVDTFRSMINGYVMVGRLDDAQRMLKKMVDTSLLKVSVHQAD